MLPTWRLLIISQDYAVIKKISRAVTGLIEYTLTYKTGGAFLYFGLLGLR